MGSASIRVIGGWLDGRDRPAPTAALGSQELEAGSDRPIDISHDATSASLRPSRQASPRSHELRQSHEPGGKVASTWRNSHDPEAQQTAVVLAFDSHDPGKVTSEDQAASVTPRLLRLARRLDQSSDAYIQKLRDLVYRDLAASTVVTSRPKAGGWHWLCPHRGGRRILAVPHDHPGDWADDGRAAGAFSHRPPPHPPSAIREWLWFRNGDMRVEGSNEAPFVIVWQAHRPTDDKRTYPAYRGRRIFTTPELGLPQSGCAGGLLRVAAQIDRCCTRHRGNPQSDLPAAAGTCNNLNPLTN
jgi:hypothetical protein